uniref:Insulin-like domain-containing protein n=1 Tax=Wuchereria bancrofti TaxID=6293 RepID=A0A1I8EA82_WUCBA
MEEAVSANYSRICGRELIYALIKKCTPTNSTYPCFQNADRKSNRSYRRGVATVCCDYGKCSQEYLATFCCEKLAVAQ